jgi:hypothetical protein
MQYDPIDDQIMSIAADRRQQLLDRHMDAMMLGALSTEREEAYRPLSDTVKAKILATMAETFPRALDPVLDPTARWSPRFREVAEATVGHGRARYQQAPHGDHRPGDRSADPGRPGVIVSGGRRPRPGDPGTVRFHPSTGEECPAYWDPPPSPRLNPYPLELPGCLWPDSGQSDTFPAQMAFADLGRVRWAPGRPTLFLAPGAPEPE